MKEEILGKLKNEVSQEINSERQVVYTFSLIRKYLELTNQKNQFETLIFYADWALHPSLERSLATKKLAHFKEESYQATLFLSFEKLRGELRDFFVQLDFPLKVVDGGWFQFRKNLVRVIKDCPLINKNYPDIPIKEFCFTRLDETVFKYDEYDNWFISYRMIFANGDVTEGSILLGDQDAVTKAELDRKQAWFTLHYLEKNFVRTMDRVKKSDGAEKLRLKKLADGMLEELKRYKQKYSLD